MPNSAVLLISEDASLVESCRRIVDSIAELRLCVHSQARGEEALSCSEDVALLLCHMVHKQDATQVIGLLRRLTAANRPVATLVLSERHYAEEALELLRRGAADYLSRPLDLKRLAYLIETLTLRARYAGVAPETDAEVVERLSDREPFFYVRSAAMGRIMSQVEVIARQETTVLLDGETGTGKTRLAALIHELSPRRAEPFLVINCRALAANLIESEMFGHVRGAFTGADRDRTGKFAEVGRGTLLLDEIDALPPSVQAKLLRAVEERVFEPVGSNESLRLQARLIVASNCSLEKEVEAGRFRSDLFYRLNVVGFYLPPLRDRRALIPRLTAHYIAQFAARNGCSAQRISASASCALEAYRWPGNIRELRNVIERAVALCPGPEIQLEHLPESLWPAGAQALECETSPVAENVSVVAVRKLGDARGVAEAALIADTLRRNGNNRLRAAMELGISRMTLYNKLRKYGLTGTV